jgi:type VI secretion system protein ImpH
VSPPKPQSPADVGPPRHRSLLQTLLDEPSRFSLDAAVAVMMRASGKGDPGAAIRFRAAVGLGFVPSDVLAVERNNAGFRATTGMIGLTGPAGVLPRPYTEMVNAEQRRRSPALASFLDLLAQRPAAQFTAAAIKYRPHRAADAAAIGEQTQDAPRDGLRGALMALTGYGLADGASRLLAGAEPILFYAGAFAARPRSADRLGAILSDWLGRPVTVEQFAGTWRKLEEDQVSALPRGGRPGQFGQLGVDAAIGASVWDIQSRIVLHVGPLPLAVFNALLPGSKLLARLVSLVRAYLEGEIGFAINPVLAADEVPPAELSPSTPPNLGRNAWLPTSAKRRTDAADAVFEADDIDISGTAP